MKIDEYFGQTEFYFSESEGRMIPLEEMVRVHLFNAWKKLQEEEPAFKGSALYERMFSLLTPSPAEMRETWTRGGKVLHLAEPWFRDKQVRAKMYRANKRYKVSTHSDGRGYITAELVRPDFVVNVSKVH
ncbi:MAG TPA: hypothetical protein VH593_26785 [Ktedonobacteraceae bacterium]|jgi:hypothetical protein